MINMIRKSVNLLTWNEKKALLYLFVAMVIMAGLEVASIASIMPFLSVASDPSTISDNYYLQIAYNNLGFESQRSFLAALGGLTLIALVISNIFIVFVVWFQNKFVWHRNHSISSRLLEGYLKRPYTYLISHNSSNLSKNVLEETREVTTQLLLPVIKGIAKGIVSLSIVALLVYVDPVLALIVSVTLGGAYFLIYKLTQKRLETIGTKRVNANKERYKAVSGVLRGAKEIKLRGQEDSFLQRYYKPSEEYASYRTINRVISKAPKYVLEAIAFGGIIVIAVYLLMVEKSFDKVIPTLGLYAFAGYRLMPALQKCFSGFAKATFNKEALDTVYKDLRNIEKNDNGSGDSDTNGFTSINTVNMDNISYKYPETDNYAIRDININIESGKIVGIVGKTGSGKSTIADVLLGLLEPTDGSVFINSEPLSALNSRMWQSSVGYVPQDVFLFDATVASNITMEPNPSARNLERLKNVTKEAQIYDFIVGELDDKFETNVGEEGVKLSGGQKQRIGIARALYHRPGFLVFDEATSGLDISTKNAVLSSVTCSKYTNTMVIISHNRECISYADKVYEITRGNIKDIYDSSDELNIAVN